MVKANTTTTIGVWEDRRKMGEATFPRRHSTVEMSEVWNSGIQKTTLRLGSSNPGD